MTCQCGNPAPPRRKYCCDRCAKRFASRRRYLAHKKELNRARWARAKSNREKLVADRRAVYGRNRGKIREWAVLVKMFGTSRVDTETKTMLAYIRAGGRVSGAHRAEPLDRGQLPEIISRIEKGETYAAYE